jgi:RNA polymerase sigma-70 factor (ECF subfamily)
MGDQTASLASWPDRDLVVAFKGGVPEAYDEMYRRYSERVNHVCRRMLGSPEDAREATQETFLKAYLALPRFNGQYKLGAWLSRIATNVCVDHIRRRGRTAVVTPLNETHESHNLDPSPEDVVIRDVPALRTLEQIQPLHAQALELRNLQGMSHKEIAEQLHMSPLQVKALLHRARSSFKRAWDNASGWALAPLVGLRSLLSHRDATSIGSQVPVWAQTAGPLVIEKVTASAMVVAIAFTGVTASRPTSDTVPASPSSVASTAFARAERNTTIAGSSQRTVARDDSADETLVADVTGLLQDVQHAADEHAAQRKQPEHENDDDADPVGPGSPDRASKKVAKQVVETLDETLPHR